MKLYNELEVKFAMDIARCQPDLTFDKVLEELTPIQLPSDEDISKESRGKTTNIPAFNNGAKWMRDKILNK